jgi:uncharacterized small protein (DUF1192 family)
LCQQGYNDVNESQELLQKQVDELDEQIDTIHSRIAQLSTFRGRRAYARTASQGLFCVVLLCCFASC